MGYEGFSSWLSSIILLGLNYFDYMKKKKHKLKRGQKVEIIWLDAGHEGGWHEEDAWDDSEKGMDIKTCGYYLGETKRTIQVVQSIVINPEKDLKREVDAMMQIPKVAITKIILI